MNNSQTIDNMLSVLPTVLAEDTEMQALAVGLAEAVARYREEIDSIRIYPNIDNLPEDLLDILAYDMKVDWWDYEFTLQEKRETLKRCWYVHKHKGTPAAVETALSAIYPDTRVEEWFQYGGEPFHFRITIPMDENSLDAAKHARVMQAVNYYKNLRSVLDSVEYSGTNTSITIWPMTGAVSVHITDRAAAGQNATGEDFLTDEFGETLLDELGSTLLDSD